MKIYAPDYYNKFTCIADKCRHSCCIGWEIDIDTDTHNRYKSISGNFGRRLSDSIAAEDDTAHFILSADERCPFLNCNGLCDIITELGDDMLCQICADHPRFRNFFDDRIEIGLGLCCEAAGEIILSRQSKTMLIEIENDGSLEHISDEDSIFFSTRQHIFDIITDRSISLKARIEQLMSEYDITLPKKSLSEWADIYLSLERLNPSWTDKLTSLKSINTQSGYVPEHTQAEIPFEQLLNYFIYRHLSDGLYDGRFSERIAFAILSIYIIYTLYTTCTQNCNSEKISDLIEIARLYSSEIEYSEENLTSLLEILSIL